MQQLGQYVVSLTAAALISGILLSLFPDGTMRTLLRLICGTALAVTALAPLTDLELPDFDSMMQDYMPEAQAASDLGEAMALAEQQELIKLGLEAYILDKAEAAGCQVLPTITLDAQGTPVSVILTGSVTEAQRQQLEEAITNDLGIPKEDQQWTGQTRRTP